MEPIPTEEPATSSEPSSSSRVVPRPSAEEGQTETADQAQTLYDTRMWHYEQFKSMAPQCGVITDLKEVGWSDDEEEEKQPAVAVSAKPAPSGFVARDYPYIFVEIESSSDDWCGFYAAKDYHVIAVHGLDDPASKQVGKEHPGTHRVIQEAAAANTLMQRYVYSNCNDFYSFAFFFLKNVVCVIS